MYARVSRYRVPIESLDADIGGADETGRKISSWPGSLGLFYMVDRDSGKTMAITLWETEEAMRDSEMAATQVRQDTSSRASAETIEIERYEVVAQPAKVPAGMM